MSFDAKPIILGMMPRQRALEVLCLDDPGAKAAAARALFATLSDDAIDADAVLVAPAALPGRPPRPRLVPAKAVPTRSPFTPEGRAALLHAIAHIEFNAINLALDAVWRFAGMPRASSVRGTSAMRAMTSPAVRSAIVHRPSWASKSP